MAARGTRGRPLKTLRLKPPRGRRVRIHVDAKLAPGEIEKLKALATEEMRCSHVLEVAQLLRGAV